MSEKVDDIDLISFYMRTEGKEAQKYLEQLCLRYEKALLNFFWKKTGNRAITEELKQETLARLIKAIKSGKYNEEKHNVSGFVFKIAKNVLNKYLNDEVYQGCRKPSGEPSPRRDFDSFDEKHYRISSGLNNEEQIAINEIKVISIRVANDISDEHKNIIALYLMGFKPKEIAKEIGKKVTYVNDRLYYVLNLLNEKLGSS